MRIYSGYIKNKKELLSTSSGGAVTALSKQMINAGGVVFGVRYSDDFYRVEYCCVDNIDDLEMLKGSKYSESYKGDIYKKLAHVLVNGRKVLFVGLGCDIASVKKYCDLNRIDTTQLYTIDILCHGPTPRIVHETFVKELEQLYESKITYFTIKYKKRGWTPFYIMAIFENGKKMVSPFDSSNYGRAFYNIARPQCTKCKYKGENHKGDLCCGDFWGITKKMKAWNRNGVSILIEQSDKGRELIESLQDDFYLNEEDPEFVLKGNPMYNFSRTSKTEYNEFLANVKMNGLKYAVSDFADMKHSIIDKIVKKIKYFFLKY